MNSSAVKVALFALACSCLASAQINPHLDIKWSGVTGCSTATFAYVPADNACEAPGGGGGGGLSGLTPGVYPIATSPTAIGDGNIKNDFDVIGDPAVVSSTSMQVSVSGSGGTGGGFRTAVSDTPTGRKIVLTENVFTDGVPADDYLGIITFDGGTFAELPLAIGGNQEILVDPTGNPDFPATPKIHLTLPVAASGDVDSGGKLKESGNALIPSGMITWIKTGSCPAGWTEETALAGMYIKATTSAAGDVGTTGGSSSYTPAGTVAAPVFTGTSSQVTSGTSAGTPAGTVSQPTFTGNAVTSSGTSAGTPAGTNSGGAFSIVTAAMTTGSGTYVPKSLGGTTLASGTASITLSTQPTFTGSALATHTHTTTATGTVSQPTFTGSALGTHTHTLTPAGTNSAPAFTGTAATITPPYIKLIPCSKN